MIVRKASIVPSALILVATSVLLASAVLLHPFYNWDIVAYAAAVKARSESDFASVHARTFEELRRVTDAATFEGLTSGDPYRQALYEHPEYLRQNLPFYQIRPLYLGAIWLLDYVTANTVRSIQLCSLTFMIMAVALILYLLHAHIAPVAVLCAPFLVIASHGLVLARYGTPDAMAFFFALLIVGLIWAGRTGVALLIMPLAVGIRTDLLIWNLLVCLWLLLLHRRTALLKLVFLGLALLASLAVFLVTNHFAGNYGWRILMWHSFVALLLDPAEAEVTFGLEEYLRELVRHMSRPLADPVLACIAMLSLALLLFEKLRDWMAADPKVWGAMLVGWGYIALHFLAFPSWQVRFFALAIALLLLGFLRALALALNIRGTTPAPNPTLIKALARVPGAPHRRNPPPAGGADRSSA